jgi:hypothetical protein
MDFVAFREEGSQESGAGAAADMHVEELRS